MVRLFLLAAALWGSLLMPALATPPGVTARSENFRLIADTQVQAAELLADLETFRVAVIDDLELAPPASDPPLRISLLSDPALFRDIAPGSRTAAIYLQGAAGADMVVDTRSSIDADGLRLMIRHELVHHLLETRYPRKLPVWLNEGLAEHYATFEPSADGHAMFGRALPGQERPDPESDWLPMAQIIESLTDYPDFRRAGNPPPDRAQRLYYGQSWALAQFVLEQPDGLARVHRFVDGWDENSDGEASFEAAFGLGYAPLESQVRSRVARPLPETENVAGGTHVPAIRPAVTVGPATQRDISINALRLLLAHGRNTEVVADRIDAVRAQLGTLSRALDVERAGALRYWRLQDWDASDAALDRVIRARPLDPMALKLRAKTAYARVSERQNDPRLWTAARKAAQAALNRLPDDAELHLFHVAVTLPTTERLPEQARASLDWLEAERTHLRHPHTAMMMIPALIYDRRFDQADAVLDSAARWRTREADRWVIERLRGNVASERAQAE